MLHAAGSVWCLQNRATHMCILYGNTQPPANLSPSPLRSFSLHFLHVITSTNPIKILFEIRFVFATNSYLSPHSSQTNSRVMREEERNKPFVNDWFHRKQNAKTLFSSFVFPPSPTLLPFCSDSSTILVLWQINDTNFSYIYLNIDRIACMRACLCVLHSFTWSFFPFTVSGTIESNSVWRNDEPNYVYTQIEAKFKLNGSLLMLL